MKEPGQEEEKLALHKILHKFFLNFWPPWKSPKFKTFIILWIFKFLFTMLFFYKFKSLFGSTVVVVPANPKTLLADITVVSAYFKTSRCIQKYRPRPEKEYFEWAKTFGEIQNPMAIFSDSPEFLGNISLIRNSENTVLQILKRQDIWAFSLQQKIGKLSRSYYDKTVHIQCAEYSAITCAKFDALELAVQNNTFKSKSFVWHDVGCFRDAKTCVKGFNFKAPSNMISGHIGALLNQGPLVSSISPKEILLSNTHSVGGGSFFASREDWIKFIPEYRKFAECLLEKRVIPLEQVVLSSMLSDKGKEWCGSPQIRLQLFNSNEQNKGDDLMQLRCEDNSTSTTVHRSFYFCYKLADKIL